MSKQKVSRNDPCPCGSGKKYKKCCGAQKQKKFSASVISSGKGMHSFFSEKTKLSSELFKK